MVRNEKIREARKKWVMEACNITNSQVGFVDFIELQNESTKEEPCDIYTEGYFKGYDDALKEVKDEMQSLAKGNPKYVNGVMNCIDILNKHLN